MRTDRKGGRKKVRMEQKHQKITALIPMTAQDLCDLFDHLDREDSPSATIP
jgi:hypothetical protein